MQRSDVFHFKQFSVSHSKSGMKVGTDAVLLGSWADFTGCVRILDVGAGTGVLSLFAAQRCPKAIIDAVEIDALAAEEASLNVANSPWKERVIVHNADFLRFESGKRYDYIITNPPFFETGEKAPDAQRALARHTDMLPLDRLIQHCSSLLAEGGLIGVVAPTEVRQIIEFNAGEAGLWIRRRTVVRTTDKKRVRRYLWEFTNMPVEMREDEIVLQTGSGRSDAYRELTRDFYIR